jgi:hypothetical protein
MKMKADRRNPGRPIPQPLLGKAAQLGPRFFARLLQRMCDRLQESWYSIDGSAQPRLGGRHAIRPADVSLRRDPIDWHPLQIQEMTRTLP